MQVASLAAGDCLGESTLLFSAPRSSDTLARTDVVAFSLSRTHMLRARPPTLQVRRC
jgi:CRP-like cAMP-binding protein